MNRTTKNYTIYDIFIMVIIVSFLGFFLENIWIALREGYIDNRNMHFPFLIGYGFAITLIWIVLGVPDKSNLFVYFIKCFFGISMGELILGSLGELLCGVYFWDYTSLPFHFTRYTSLFTSLCFAFIITMFMWKCFCPLMDIIHEHDSKSKRVISTVLLAVLLFDFMFSFTYMFNNQSYYDSWKLEINTDNITQT